LNDRWRSRLLEVFGNADIPYMDEARLREQIMSALQGSPARLSKGPLQIILENEWIEWLKR
jgi:hypothetical protein